jgi:hypothetical protein
MDLSKLAELKEQMGNATVFSDVWTFFLDHFGEKKEFMALGEPAGDQPFLMEVLAHVGKELFGGDEVRVSNMILVRLPEYNFIHGGGVLNTKLCNVIYFEDIAQGILAIPWSWHPSETKLIRFRGQPLRPAYKPSVN